MCGWVLVESSNHRLQSQSLCGSLNLAAYSIRFGYGLWHIVRVCVWLCVFIWIISEGVESNGSYSTTTTAAPTHPANERCGKCGAPSAVWALIRRTNTIPIWWAATRMVNWTIGPHPHPPHSLTLEYKHYFVAAEMCVRRRFIFRWSFVPLCDCYYIAMLRLNIALDWGPSEADKYVEASPTFWPLHVFPRQSRTQIIRVYVIAGHVIWWPPVRGWSGTAVWWCMNRLGVEVNSM